MKTKKALDDIHREQLRINDSVDRVKKIAKEIEQEGLIILIDRHTKSLFNTFAKIEKKLKEGNS